MEIASLGNAESLRVTITHELEPCDTRGEVERAHSGRLYVGRRNERVRAKRCDAVDWGLLKR